jgi:signal transduction histidine kinase
MTMDAAETATETTAPPEQPTTIARLAGGAAHEIRNPLAIMRMALDNVARSLPGKPERAQVFLEDLYTALRRTENIVTEMLRFGAPKDLKLEACNVVELAEAVCAEFRDELNQRNICLRPCFVTPPPHAMLDRERMHEVLSALFCNALEAMPDGGTLEVSVFTDRPDATGAEVVVQVRDTGPGIPDDLLPYVQEPFFTTRRGHLGMSLAAAATVARMHGGSLVVTNHEAGGAVACLHLAAGAVPLREETQ